MPRTCGNPLENRWKLRSIISAQLSTVRPRVALNPPAQWTTRRITSRVYHPIYTTKSTSNYAISPLFEQKFYPFSTAPITKTTN